MSTPHQKREKKESRTAEIETFSFLYNNINCFKQKQYVNIELII